MIRNLYTKSFLCLTVALATMMSPISSAAQLVDHVELYNGLCVKPGGTMPVDAHGWKKDDRLLFEVTEGRTGMFEAKVIMESDTTAHIKLPRKMQEAKYMVTLLRGNKRQRLGLTLLRVPEKMPKGTPVSAHRGVFNAPGSAQNSRQSIQLAIDMGIKACEIDVWRTQDGVLVINHDAKLNGIIVQNATSEEVKKLRLSNGETVPLLSELLDMIKPDDVKLNLMVQIKRHTTEEKNKAVVEDVVKMIKEYGLEKKVCFISFGYNICKHLAAIMPMCPVYYIEHVAKKSKSLQYKDIGIVDFDEVKKAGIAGLTLGAGWLLKDHPEWMEEAHEKGLGVNCCVYDGVERCIIANNDNAEYITTNTPEIAQRIYLHYRNNQ